MRVAGFFGENADLIVEADAVDFVGGGVGEEDFAVRAVEGPRVLLKPSATSFQSSPGMRISCARGALGPALHFFGPVLPQIGHRLHPVVGVARAVAAVDDAELVIVAGKLQRLVHFLIEQEPVARDVFHVARAGGQKRARWAAPRTCAPSWETHARRETRQNCRSRNTRG
jgi:hypothetical protein